MSPSSRVAVKTGRGTRTSPRRTTVPGDDSGVGSENEPTDEEAQDRAAATVHRRIQERREGIEFETRMAFRRLVVSAIGGIIVGAALIGIVFFTPLLRVRSVEVVGAVHESSATVEEAAGVPLDGTLAEVAVGEIAANVEMLPWVRRAEVSRRLPWTVRIEVVERRPVALADVGGGRALVDEEGVVLEPVTPDAPPPAGLPVVVGTEPLPRAGQRWGDEAGHKLVRTASRIPVEFTPRVASMSLENENLVIELVDGVVVRFGPPEGMDRKVEVLEAVLEDLARRQVAVTAVDVSAEGSPAVVPAA
ncbi:MAG: FtsQ-type POTRA domain-containing protein [Acidimicrobiia bacterium]|nr:FtsQ-type POTRA domain-containing protein [Acidimicrobiia bacterium]